jgi:enterochelin esterase-like enzyme
LGIERPLPMRRLRGADLWYASVELPPGARMEYRVLVRRGDHVESILDPLNPAQVTGPVGQVSVLEAAGYQTPWWALYNAGSVPGEMTELTLLSRALRRDVHVTLYSPGRMRMDDRLPLLVLHDGADFLNHASMGVVLDNLMDKRLVADCVVAFTHPVDRLKEYGAGAAHSRFLTAELVPQLEKRLPLRGEPAGRFLAGASFGGIAALTAAVRAPGFYGGLLLQSPSFMFTLVGRGHQGGPVFDPVVRFVNSLRANPRRVAEKMFVSYGAFEPAAHRILALVDTLQHMADDVRVRESLDGHNWTGWRDGMFDGLGWLLPGDARFVYP